MTLPGVSDSRCTCPPGWGAHLSESCPMHGTVKRTRIGEGDIPAAVLFSDRVLDRTLDELAVHLAAAGHDVKPGFEYGVARWDLKAALRKALELDPHPTEPEEASA